MMVVHINKLYTLLLTAAAVVCCLVAGGVCQAQARLGADVVTLTGGTCEVDEANLDTVRQAALDALGADQVLLAVARLGIADRKPRRNRTRLDGVKANFARLRFPPGKLVLAQDEGVTGQGRVEFYISGRLSHMLLMAPDGVICPQCCNPEAQDFTPTKRVKRKGGRPR